MSTGYGTYITAGLIAAATFAHTLGWISDSTYQTIIGVLGAGGLTFLRAAQSASDSKNATANAVIAQSTGVPPAKIAAAITAPAGVAAP